jgi:hypothetical protein
MLRPSFRFAAYADRRMSRARYDDIAASYDGMVGDRLDDNAGPAAPSRGQAQTLAPASITPMRHHSERVDRPPRRGALPSPDAR